MFYFAMVFQIAQKNNANILCTQGQLKSQSFISLDSRALLLVIITFPKINLHEMCLVCIL